MSQPRGIHGPFWSAKDGQSYWYNSENDRFIYQDGTSIRRPANVSRSQFLPPGFVERNTSSTSSENVSNTRSSSTANQTPNTAARAVPGNERADSTVDVTRSLGVLKIAASSHPSIQTARNSSQPVTATTRPSDTSSVRAAASDSVGPDGTTTHQQGPYIRAVNPKNKVQTLYQTGPSDEITDPDLFRTGRGKGAVRMLLRTGSEGDTEQLFSTFEIRTSPRRFFTVGKVFMILWSEPAGSTLVTEGVSARTPGTTRGRYGEPVFSKVRRFVVIREAATYCSALPIATYGWQGVGKANVTKSEHAIIYTGKSPPAPMPSEEPVRGELGMRPDAIRVDPDDREDKLDPRSRIDFGKVHTIQHNIKVKSYGKVNDKSLQALIQQFQNCWLAPAVATISPIATSSQLPRVQEETHAQGDTASSGHRSQNRGVAAGGAQGTSTDRNMVARLQERHRQQYWRAVARLQQTGMSGEQAREAINARLRRRQEEAIRAGRDADDTDDDDDEEE